MDEQTYMESYMTCKKFAISQILYYAHLNKVGLTPKLGDRGSSKPPNPQFIIYLSMSKGPCE